MTTSFYIILSVVTLQMVTVPGWSGSSGYDDYLPGAVPPPIPPVVLTAKPSVSSAPTANPITNEPTSHPTTYEPTVDGETRLPSVSPSSVPSVSPTAAYIIQTSDDDSAWQDARDRNHNGKDDTLEFYSIPAVPIQAVCFLITLTLFIPVIHHMHFKKRESKMPFPLTIKVPVTLTFLCNNICIVCITVVSIMIGTANIDEWDQRMYNIALIPYYTASVTYALGKLCLEMFFIFRVFHAFKTSAFKLSRWMMLLFCSWAVMISVAWFMMFYLVTIDQNLSFKVPYYGYLMLSVVEMLFVVTLLYMFTKRLTKLVLLHKINRGSTTTQDSQRTPESVVSTVTKDGCDINNENCTKNNNESVDYSTTDVKSIQSNLSFQQTRMIFLITRCILTSSFAIITTILFGVILFYFEEFGIHIFMVYALWAVDLMTNCICLFLNFAFSTKIYNRCCKMCHGACQDMLEYCAAKRLLKQEYNEST